MFRWTRIYSCHVEQALCSHSYWQLDEEIQVLSWVCGECFAVCLAELNQPLAPTHIYVENRLWILLPSTSIELTELILLFDVNTELLAGPAI